MLQDREKWSADEHARFLQGLDNHASGLSMNPAATWRAITLTVETKSLLDVRAHAREYYMQLQAVNSEKRKEYARMQQIDTRWSMEEDTRFEQLLAQYSDTTTFPWEVIASQLPHKTVLDVQERYQKLCYDVARIDKGQNIMMQFGRHQRLYERPQGSEINYMPEDEIERLYHALHLVSVPSHTSREVLAAIASAVALLTSNIKQPIRRRQPRNAIPNMRQILERVIQLGLTDPHAVLAILVQELNISLGSPCSNLNYSSHTATNIPYPDSQETNDPTFPATDLLYLRRSPVHHDHMGRIGSSYPGSSYPHFR